MGGSFDGPKKSQNKKWRFRMDERLTIRIDGGILDAIREMKEKGNGSVSSIVRDALVSYLSISRKRVATSSLEKTLRPVEP